MKDLYSSYKDLPLSIYQIQTKYRDEARPRAGLLRGREFVMKDSYSFDVDDAGLSASLPAAPRGLHQDLRPARLRLRHRHGDQSGAMGGSKSEEFLASADGRRGHLRALHALRLRRERRGRRTSAARPPCRTTTRRPRTPRRRPDTPDHRHAGRPPERALPREDRPWTAGDTLKNVAGRAPHPDGTREPLAIGLPGDREVDQKRLEAAAGALEVEPLRRGRLRRTPRLVKGYIGPGVLGEKSASGIRYLARPPRGRGHPLGHRRRRRRQPRPRPGGRPRLHRRRHDRGRRGPRRRPVPGRAAEGTLESARGIEMGHIFQLGRKYAEALGLKVLDENGKLVTVTMGSYGIGPSRAVAAIAENTLDELGLCWPREVAPADVHVVATGKDAAVFAAAEQLADELSRARARRALRRPRRKVSPGREVQGRRADRRPAPWSPSGVGWPTAPWRSGTGAPTSARRCPWPRPPRTWSVVRG